MAKETKVKASKNKLPDSLADRFEIVGDWPEGTFQVVGLEVSALNLSTMSEEMANHLVKIKWKGIRRKESTPE